MEEELRFGPFSIVPARRSLTQDGETVPLGSRAVDILLFLLSEPGVLKTNAEIVSAVWPSTFVDDANLRVHVSALRKALGDIQREPRYIANVPGRGYRFVAEVARGTPAGDAAKRHKPRIPSMASRIFGREETVLTIARQLDKGRLLTVAGTGGIGKSTIARAVVATLPPSCDVVWIDLSEIADGNLIPSVIASGIGISTRSEDLLRDIAHALDGSDALLVLDSCEHVVSRAAELCEDILARTARLRILATSREPLRAQDERVHRLTSLELPLGNGSAAEAIKSPAVQLFVDRADACLGGYELTDEDAPHVIDICARLDGIALAIELAAGRLETVGVQGLSRALTDCFNVLTRGRRTALPRHQTLRAMLDWSYLILSPTEQQALRELSVFRGRFTASAAGAIVSDLAAEEMLVTFVAKSLVIAERSANGTNYRLLDTTRLYAAEKLDESGATDAVMSRFTGYLCQTFEGSEQELYSLSTEAWSQDFAQQLPAVRSALHWAFSEDGDPLAGARLTIATLPLFFRLSLIDECLGAVTQAINFLDQRPDLDERTRMKLYAALGWPQMRALGAPEHGIAAWTTAIRIAETLGDIDHQLRGIWALWVDALNRAEPHLGMDYARRFKQLAAQSDDPADLIVGKRMVGATLHWLGRHEEALVKLREMLADYERVPQSRHSVRFQFDQRVTARIMIARCLWFLGQSEAAFREVDETIDYAVATGHLPSLANVLAEAACPLALLSGDNELAAQYIQLLRDNTKPISLDVWHVYADCFEAELHLRAGRIEDCLRQLRQAKAVLGAAGFILFRTMFEGVEASARAERGEDDDALELLRAAQSRGQKAGEYWCLPELIRIEGRVHRKLGKEASAAQCLAAAAEQARLQGAVGWLRRIEADIIQL